MIYIFQSTQTLNIVDFHLTCNVCGSHDVWSVPMKKKSEQKRLDATMTALSDMICCIKCVSYTMRPATKKEAELAKKLDDQLPEQLTSKKLH